MILPGTLVQYIGTASKGRHRRMGVYSVRAAELNEYQSHWLLDEGESEPCGGISYRVWTDQSGPNGTCSCFFRIIAPPITEADRLEASAPDAPAKPKRVRA